MKQIFIIALSLFYLSQVMATDKGSCKAAHFSNGRFDLDESKYPCNQDKGYFPLLDTKTGKCSCEKGFEFEIKAQLNQGEESSQSV